MPITHVHTYLVHPAKGVKAPKAIGGSALPLSGKMFDLLSQVYERSDIECNVGISFNKSSDGRQANDFRDLLVDHTLNASVLTGQALAERLAKHTDQRSNMGLLFLIVGTEGLDHKVIVSRFPADSGILAEQTGANLSVSFLERIFMKSAKSYKAVLYRHASPSAGFWKGKAIDKQMNDSSINVSGYWITDFLDSDFLTTSEAGTRRLAVACRNAARGAPDLTVKSEIAAAVTLASGQNGRSLTTREFVQRFGLSTDAQNAIFAQMKPHLLDDKFQFNAQEFSSQVAYRTLELDNGATISAETQSFDQVFQTEQLGKGAGKIRIITEGNVVSERLSKANR